MRNRENHTVIGNVSGPVAVLAPLAALTDLEHPLLPVRERGPLVALVLKLGALQLGAAEVVPGLAHHARGHHHEHVAGHGAAAHHPLGPVHRLDDAVAPLAGLQSGKEQQGARNVNFEAMRCPSGALKWHLQWIWSHFSLSSGLPFSSRGVSGLPSWSR